MTLRFGSKDQLIRLVSNGNERHVIYIPRSYLKWSGLYNEIQEELKGLACDGIFCPFPEEFLDDFFSLIESLAFSEDNLKGKFTLNNLDDLIKIAVFFKMKKIFWDKLLKLSDRSGRSKILKAEKESMN